MSEIERYLCKMDLEADTPNLSINKTIRTRGEEWEENFTKETADCLNKTYSFLSLRTLDDIEAEEELHLKREKTKQDKARKKELDQQEKEKKIKEQKIKTEEEEKKAEEKKAEDELKTLETKNPKDSPKKGAKRRGGKKK